MRFRLEWILVATVSAACESEYGLEPMDDRDGHGSFGSSGGPGGGTVGLEPPDLWSDPPPELGTDDDLDPDPIPVVPSDPSDPSVPDTGLVEDGCAPGIDLTSWLDGVQTPSDGAVTYCHSGNGGQYLIIDTNVSSCLPHLGHPFDVFPTTGCDS